MKMPLLRTIAVVVTLCTPAAPVEGGAQQTERERQRERRERLAEQEQSSRLDTTIAFGGGGIVELSLISGEIIVRQWARPEVQVRASLERGRIHAELTSSRVSLTVRSGRYRGGEGRFELQVPVGTRVFARGTSADIRISGVKAAVEARSTSGDIVVDGAADRISMESVSGDIVGRSLAGTVSASAVSGDVELDTVTGDCSSSTVSGDITLTRVVSRDVRVETVSGEVQYEGSIDKTGRYEFQTHSGNIAFGIPDGAGASLSLETFSGEIDSDFPVTIQPRALGTSGRRRGTQRLDTTVGGGGARIIAETFSGNITIEKVTRR